MPRVICQVLQHPERITFIWSDGCASFAPYHLSGEQAVAFHGLVRRARERLAELALGTEGAVAALAQAGWQIYQAVFPQQATAIEVQAWLRDLESKDAVESLEIAGDIPGAVPWNVVYERAPDEKALAAGEATALQAFWGVRYRLTSGRRVNRWRLFPFLQEPGVLVAIDPVLRDALSEEQRNRFAELTKIRAIRVVESGPALASELESREPDVLYLFCRPHPQGITLGQDTVTFDELEKFARGGESEPLLFLNVCREPGDRSESATPQYFSRLLASGIDGLLATEHPLAAADGHIIGMEFLDRFVHGGDSLGAVLQRVRQQIPAGLLISSSGPAHLRISNGDAAGTDSGIEQVEPLPLPESPYRPLAPYDREQRALFVGREAEIADFVTRLDRADTRLLILHGVTGVGKSSFLHAGVVPFLEDEAVGYQALRDRTPDEEAGVSSEKDFPVVAIRASQDLAGQVAVAVCAFCEQPYSFASPTGTVTQVDLPEILGSFLMAGVLSRPPSPGQGPPSRESVAPGLPPALPGDGARETEIGPAALWRAFQDDPTLLARILAALSEALPFELVILIEQGEEVFTQAARPVDRRRRLALDMLAPCSAAFGRYKLIYSLRTEHLGKLLEELPLDRKSTFLLSELGDAGALEAILLPTISEPIPYGAEVPYEKYGFTFAEGVPETIVKQTRAAAEGPEHFLSRLQATCAQLYQRLKSDRTIRRTDVSRPWWLYLLSLPAAFLVLLAFRFILPSRETAQPLHLRILWFLIIAGVIAGLIHFLWRRQPLKLSSYVETRFPFLTRRRDRRKLKELCRHLSQPQADTTVVRTLVPLNEVTNRWHGSVPLESVVDATTADDVRLFELNQLLVGGKEGLYLSLGTDGLLPVVSQWKEEAKSRAVALDMLWIFLPLLFLVGVMVYVFIPRGTTTSEDTLSKEQVIDLLEKQQQQFQAGIQDPLYTGRLSQVEQAGRAGNALRMRQLLLTPTAVGKADISGFEWRYLWRQAMQERRAFMGHKNQITSVAMAPDGKLLASASLDGAIVLWEENGAPRAVVEGHGGAVNALGFSPDGTLLATAGADKFVLIWEVAAAQGEVKRSQARSILAGHNKDVLALAFTRDGIASADANGDIILWDAARGSKQRELKGHTGALMALAFAPDGKTLASAGADQTVSLWDRSSGKQQVLRGHGGPIQALAFSPDGARLASGGAERREILDRGIVRLWDVKSAKEISHNIEHSSGVLTLAFGDNKFLFTGGKDSLIRVWDSATGQQVGSLRGHFGWVSSLAARGSLLASGSYDQSVKIWTPSTALRSDVIQAAQDGVCSLALSPNGRILVSGGQDGTIKLWDTLGGESLQSVSALNGAVLALAFSPDPAKTRLAAGTWNQKGEGEIAILEVSSVAGEKAKLNVKKLHTLKGHKGGIACLAFSPNGEILASGGSDEKILFWDVTKGDKKRELSGHKGGIRGLTFSPKDPLLAGGGDDMLIHVWDTSTGQEKQTLQGHSAAISALAYFPDGWLVSAGHDQTLQLWKDDGTQVGTLRGHGDAVLALAIHPKKEWIFSGSLDQTIKTWGFRPGSDERFTFTGHTGAVRALAFSTDGALLVSAGNDGTIRLWRAAIAAPEP